MILYLNFYMQDILGYRPLAAGIRFLPITVLAFVISPIAGKLTVKVSSRYLLGLGLILIALGCDLATHVRPNSTWTVLLPGFIVAGFGIGITNPVVASAAVSVVPPEHSGMASGASDTFRQVGIATGIAGLGAVFLSQIRPATVTALAGTPAGRIMLAHRRLRRCPVPSPKVVSARWHRRSHTWPHGKRCSAPTGSASRPRSTI